MPDPTATAIPLPPAGPTPPAGAMDPSAQAAQAGPPEFWAQARRSLARRDRVLGGIMRACGPLHLVPRSDPYLTLARSIVGQQISVAAAQTIWGRVEKACGTVHPDRVARMREATLTRCGLSARKVEYLRDLSVRFRTGELDPARLAGHGRRVRDCRTHAGAWHRPLDSRDVFDL
jgi:DNA-3-methyladenine glycosylase II